MNVSGSQIDPEKWSNWLKEATSQSEGARKYIVLQGQADNQTYALLEKSAFGPDTHRLSIAEIQKISREQIDKLAQHSRENIVSKKVVSDFTNIAKEISKQNEKLIQLRQKKENRIINRFLRRIMLVISVVLPAFGLKLKEDLASTEVIKEQSKQFKKAIQEEIKRLKSEKEALDAGVINEVIDSQALKENNRVVQDLLKVENYLHELIEHMHVLKREGRVVGRGEYEAAEERLKTTIQDILSTAKEFKWTIEQAGKFVAQKQFFANDSIKELNNPELLSKLPGVIQRIYEDDLTPNPKNPHPLMLQQFQKDLSRQGVSFLRSDPYLGIEDNEPMPPAKGPLEQRLPTAFADISEIVEGNHANNTRWLPILQLAVTQTALNATFLVARGLLTEQFLSPFTVVKQGKDEIAFEADFPSGFPPVRLKIIRDENTHEIEKVHVTIEGHLDLTKREEESIIIPGIVQASMNYTITLSERNQPIINDFQCHYTTTLSPI